LLIPGVKRIIQLLGCSKGIEIPWITTLVAVFGVSANGYSSSFGDTTVDCVDRAERISDDFVVGQSPVGATVNCQ
jgi:hypothetical protein